MRNRECPQEGWRCRGTTYGYQANIEVHTTVPREENQTHQASAPVRLWSLMPCASSGLRATATSMVGHPEQKSAVALGPFRMGQTLLQANATFLQALESNYFSECVFPGCPFQRSVHRLKHKTNPSHLSKSRVFRQPDAFPWFSGRSFVRPFAHHGLPTSLGTMCTS